MQNLGKLAFLSQYFVAQDRCLPNSGSSVLVVGDSLHEFGLENTEYRLQPWLSSEFSLYLSLSDAVLGFQVLCLNKNILISINLQSMLFSIQMYI